jgi:hypothetical protein
MSVQCLTCMSLRLKGVAAARSMFGQCKFKPAHELVSVLYPRECHRHSQADAHVGEQRQQWAARTTKGRA